MTVDHAAQLRADADWVRTRVMFGGGVIPTRMDAAADEIEQLRKEREEIATAIERHFAGLLPAANWRAIIINDDGDFQTVGVADELYPDDWVIVDGAS